MMPECTSKLRTLDDYTMQFRLRTLLIVLAILPPLLAATWQERELLIELYGRVLHYDIDDKLLGFCETRPGRKQQPHVNYSASFP